jgi:hypothetical protein
MADSEARNPALTRFEGGTPILRVRSLEASIDYYVTVLGFRVDWQDPGIIAGLSRDRCARDARSSRRTRSGTTR